MNLVAYGDAINSQKGASHAGTKTDAAVRKASLHGNAERVHPGAYEYANTWRQPAEIDCTIRRNGVSEVIRLM
ncbi:MAG: hypothetical protein SFY81_15540 [Verrucomicrobiota bacterium]|nr:hypothetical protein [Verrucomicrobiota bacterium]